MGEGPRFPGVVPLENLVGTGIPVMVLLGAMLIGAVHRAPAGVVAVHLPVGPSELTEGLTVVISAYTLECESKENIILPKLIAHFCSFSVRNFD